jgi:tetratricopeptide (TPR) repeat protein
VPIDREAALRTAERLLRQGKLDGAIEQYVRLVEDQPRDWNSINTLGDLYVRAGNTERAVAQYVRIADHLFAEGFLPKASALYKKALKVRNDHEHTLFRLSDIAAQQGLLADAKLYLRQLAQQRKGRGDEKGAAECILRIGSIDEDDGESKIAAARTAAAMGNTGQAVTIFQEAAEAFDKQKRTSDALDARLAAAELVPEDGRLRADVARALIAAGQFERAQPFLSAETAGDDVDLLLAIGRHDLEAGRSIEAQATLMRVVALAPDRRPSIENMVSELVEAGRVTDGYACLEVLVDAAMFEADFESAASLLDRFVANHALVPALLKLVDIYVDAGFDDRISSVQGRLADAYLDAAQAAEARVIAEDLMSREPQTELHTQRLRRALMMLGVDDPEAVIARQLESDPLFDSTFDVSEQLPESALDMPVPVSRPPEPLAAAPAVATPASLDSIDVSDLLDATDLIFDEPAGAIAPTGSAAEAVVAPSEPVSPESQTFEIDLSATLAELNTPLSSTPSPTASVAREEQIADAEALFERAQEHLRRGMAAEAAAALQSAVRVPQMRFRAAAQLGRISSSRGDWRGAVEWLERAAEAPAPSTEETFAVLYDLADALDRVGEPVRALAIFMELEADAGSYRDVRARIDQLTRGAAGASSNGDRT